MNETTTFLGTTGTVASNHPGITTTQGYSGLTVSSNTVTTPASDLYNWPTIVSGNPAGYSIAGTVSNLNNSNNMTPKQVNVVVFTITRDADTNEINSTKFLKELWIEQKNGTSIDLLVAKQLGNDFDPELTIIKVLATVSF